jgi:hypothetical protein
LSQYNYLTLAFLRQSQATFDEAEKAGASNPVLLRRVRHARLPVDRACLVFWPKLVREWIASDGQPDKMPLDREAIASRCRETWYAQINLRFTETQRPVQRAEADAELTPLLARPSYVPLPERFRRLPPKDVFDFTAETSNNWQNQAKRVPDKDAESGITDRLELSDAEMQKYKLPMPWGAYDPARKRGLASASIKAENVPGSGYHWYKLDKIPITPSSYVYFFWSWIIQFPIEAAVDPQHPDRKYEVWARIKFEGPGFPHGGTDQTNAICVERVVLIQSN